MRTLISYSMHIAQAIVALFANRSLAFAYRNVLWLGLGVLVWQMLSGLAAAEPPEVADPADESQSADLASEPEIEAEPELGTDWVRIQYDAQREPLAMQTAIIRYVREEHVEAPDGSPVAVDLVAAVHVGDAAYYKQLNERFKKYDVLLYELVAQQGTVVPQGRGTPNDSLLGMLQNGMKTVLELEHQLELVDYTQPNFVHADMSPQQLMQAMEDRNEGFMQMYFRLMGATMAAQEGKPQVQNAKEFDLVATLLAPDRARLLKILLGEQLADMESLMVGLSGPNGLAIISERNRVALDVLQEQIDAGKKQIGIFYGAGHLSDMHERLEQDFDLVPADVIWLTAWDLSPQP